MTVLKYWQAINRALAEEMARDPRVVLLGEDVGAPGGAFGASKGLVERFGPERVRDTPISELAIAGVGVGAALVGLRPVVEIMFNDFLTLAMDQLANQAAKLRFMTAGDGRVPLVVRTVVGAGRGTGPQHGQSLEAWLAHVPGLKVVAPANPRDARALLKAAVRDDDPVVVFESLALWGARGEVPEEEDVAEIGRAAVVRRGRDVTLVAHGGAVPRALEAAAALEAQGVGVDVIDLRSLQPLDYATIAASVRKTGRLAIVHDAVKFLGPGAEVAAWAAEELFSALRAPVVRVAPPFSPVPFAPELERRYFPDVDAIAGAVMNLART